MSKTVAEVIVETLQAAGVRHCWGVPGDTLNYVTDAIRRSDIEWVHVRYEEAGGFAAGAEALLTGNLTACAGSCGTALYSAKAMLDGRSGDIWDLVTENV